MALFSISDAQLAFGHVALLDHTDFSLEAGERVGLIGRNGTGKSSLLRIVAGMSAPDDGLIARQSGVTTAYVAQEPQFAPGLTVFDAVSLGMGAAHDLLARYEAALAKLDTHHDEATLAELHRVQAELDAADAWTLRTRVETTLARLGLDPHVRVDALSGGLQKRVALAQGLVAEPDILLLDEPTNDLDIDTLELLEELLQDYSGTVFLVSHDRAFLDNVVTSTIAAEGEGQWRESVGGYSDWEAQSARAEAIQAAKPAEAKPAEALKTQNTREARGANRTVKLSYKEQRELDGLPERINALETEQKTLAGQLADGALYATDPAKAAQLATRHDEIEMELLEALERWEVLEAKTKGEAQ